jgi:hypothetical protein
MVKGDESACAVCCLTTLSTPKFMYHLWQRNEWVWISAGMVLTEGNRNTWRKDCPSATLSIANLRLDCRQHWGRRLTPRAMTDRLLLTATALPNIHSLGFCCSDFTESNCSTINKQWIGRDVEVVVAWLWYYHAACLNGFREGEKTKSP